MKPRLEHAFLFVIALEAVKMYTVVMEHKNSFPLYYIANSLDWKPFVFRVLLPLLSRLLYYVFGGDIVFWLGFLFVLSAIGAYFGMKYLYESFYDDGRIAAFVGFQFLILLCLFATKVYDYATAAFFAVSLGLLARGKLRIFLILFPIATLNRETTFLLTLFFAVWFWKKLPLAEYLFYLVAQFAMYGAIKVSLSMIFANNGGQDVYLELWRVLKVYSQFWAALLVLVPIIYLIARSWKNIPEFIRVAILVIVPAQIIIHLLFGQAFEIRVFAESIPIACFMRPSRTLFPRKPLLHPSWLRDRLSRLPSRDH